MKFKPFLYLLAALLLACLLFPAAVSAEDGTVADTATLQASIYTDAGGSNKTVDLTDAGATFAGWDYNSSRYLKIQLNNLSTAAQYRVVVEMEPILYIESMPDFEQASIVSSKKNAAITVNKTGKYTPNANSYSSLVFSISSGINKIDFFLPLRYDQVLWDKNANSTLEALDGSTPILRVYLQKVEGSTPMTVQGSSKCLKNAMAGIEIKNADYINFKDAANNRFGVNITRTATETMILECKQFSNSTYGQANYVDDLVVTLTVPNATINGTAYVMEHALKSVDISGKGSADYTVSQNGTVYTYTFGPTLLTTAGLFSFDFAFSDDVKDLPDVYTFKGQLKIEMNGAVYYNSALTVTLNNLPDPNVTVRGGDGSASIYDAETVQFLGYFGILNSGGILQESTHVKMDFDTNSKHTVGVTTVRLPINTVYKTYTITYSLADAQGQPYIDGNGKTVFEYTMTHTLADGITDDSSSNLLFYRGLLPTEHQGYYFKSIEYDIPQIRKDSKIYGSSGSRNRSAAGTIWGYVLTNTPPTSANTSQHRITLTGADLGTKTKTITSIINSDRNPSMGLTSPAVSAPSVEAGDSFTIHGTASILSYPYGSNNCLSNIRVGLLLPLGVSVNIDASTCAFSDAVAEQISDKPIVGSDKHFVIVQFNSTQKIGYASESLDPIPNGTTCKFSIVLTTERTVSSQVINLLESVFLAGENRTNSASSAQIKHQGPDTYDLNGNNSTTDTVGTFDQKTVKTSISIIGAPAQLDVEGQVRKSDGTVSSDAATMEDYTDYFYYDLTISNTSGGVARDFTYLIPLLTQTHDETDFVSEREDIRFVLLNRPELYTIGGTDFELYYTTTTFLDYEDAYANANSSEWFPYSQLTAEQYDQVTMLKLRTKDDAAIQHGDSVTVSLYLNYHEDALEYLTDAGKKVTWASRGYYSYEAATSSMTGHLSSNPITVSLKAVIIYVDEGANPDLESVHLTADANDTANLALKTDAFDLQAFDKAQKYTIAKVGTAVGSTGNVVLVPYGSAIPDPNSNDTFGIQVQITYDTGSGPYQSTPTSLHEVGTVVGSVNANTPAKFTFYLSHGKAISQNTEGLMANIILLGDNGVAIDITIDIHRVLTQATAGESGLFAGEVYIMQDAALQDTVVISNRSTLTAQFSNQNVTPKSYGKRVLTFGEALPQGTMITMADLTDTAKPKYYYYPVSVSDLTSLELTAFYKMGSSSTQYQYSNLNEMIYETFLFVFSFPTNQTLNHTSTIRFTLSPTPEASASDPPLTEKVSEAYGFSVQDATTFSLTPQEREVDYGDAFTLTVTSTPPANIPDNYYYSQRMTLILQSSSPNAPLTSDATLFVEDKEYHPDRYGRFIIPLESVGGNAKTLTRTISFRSFTQPHASLHACLFTHSGTEGLPFGGEPVGQAVEINIRERTQPALLVTGMRSCILHRDTELKADVPFGIQLQNIGTNDSLTLEVQQKRANAYSTMTTALNTLDGSAEHKQGVFFVQVTPLEDPSSPYEQSLRLRFNPNIPAGTYRILFTATANGHTLTVPYDFIVTE